MFWLIASAAALDPGWDCGGETFATLEEMQPWYVWGQYGFGAVDALEEWRDAQVDDLCVPVDCSYTPEELFEFYGEVGTFECSRYTCLTRAGTLITWSSTELALDEAFPSTVDAVESWAVMQPDGTRVDVVATTTREAYLWGYTSSEEESTFTATWTGAPVEGLPADSEFEYSLGSASESVGVYEEETGSFSWEAGTCTVTGTSGWNSYDEEYRGVVVGTDSGSIVRSDGMCYPSWYGTLDGVLVGPVDETSWVLLLEDADHDGSPVGHDCDDTDPNVSPCETDTPADGIDQDCDGLDG